MTRAHTLPADDGLASAKLTRQLRKCIAAGTHNDGTKCERCGL